VASKELNPVEQGELALSRRAPANDMPIELIRRQKTGAAAFSLACQSSGLEDKEIYLAIGIDAGYFSRIKAGTATLQADLVPFFCEVVGNRIYPEWQAFQVGCTLVQIQSEAERLLAIEREARKEAELKVRVLMDTFHARASA
jgi:hypothetical protein